MISCEHLHREPSSIALAYTLEMDGKPVGDGKPGPVAEKLRALYVSENMKAAV